MWASPGQIPVAIEMLTDAAGNTTERVTQMQRLQKLQTLQAVRNTMPSEMIGAMRHSMPGPGLGSANNAFAPLGTMDTSRPDRSLSDLVRTFNEHVTDMPRVAGGRMATQRLGRLPQGLKRQAARNNGWLAGVFNRMTGATRLEIPLDFVTLTHEGGHALEHRAATSGAIDSLKTKYAQELMMPPMPDSQPAAFPPQGYSGIELDEHAMAALMTYYEASSEVKALQRRSNAGYRTDSFTLETTTQTAETAAATLVRRLGQTPAEMVMSDFEAQGLPPHQAIAYANRRFTRTGTPQPRAMVLIEAEQLSEGWGDWFQTYLTDPDAAKATAPELFTEFTDEIDGLDPELLMILEELQDGYQELMAASPVSAMRSRIKSAFARGRREEALERYNERKNRRLSTSGPVSARGSAGIQTLGEELATSSYSWIRDYVDNKHPMKVAVKTLLDLGVANGNIAVEEGKKLFLKASANPYKLWRLATHTKTHAVATILHGPAINGSIDGVGPSVRDALVTAFGGDGAREFSVENQELFGTYLASRRLLAEWDRYDRGELPEPPDQMVSRNQLLQVIAEMDMQFPRFQDGAQQIYAFQNNFLTYLHEQGFLSEEDMLEYQSRADYVPLNRIMDRFGMINALKRATGVNKGKVMHRFLGSTRDIINPLESIVQGVFNFVERAETNAVGSRMLDLAEWAGDGGASIAERLPPTDMRATTVGVRETLMQAARSSGIARDDLGALMAEVDGLFDAEATATIFRPTMTQERPDERIMYVYRDGKRIPVLLGDNQIARDIYEQFGTFGQENTNFVMQTMVAGAQVLRAGVTKAPAYIYNNFFRDQVQVGAYTRDYTPFKTGFEGLKSVGKDADGSRRYTRFAGLMGGVDSNIMNLGNQKFGIGSFRSSGFWAVPGQWKAARGWNKFLRTMEITEAGSRVGHFESAFRRAIADNMSTEEAAIEAAYAADDVMPFGRRGSRMQTLSRIMHFANAGIQGVSATNRTIRGERDAPGETWRPAPFDATTNLEDEPFIKAMSGETLSNAERKRLPNSVRVWVAMAGLAGISLALKMWYSDEPEEDEANDYRSATHWRIRTADIKPFVPESVRENIPDWLYFPKPFDIAVIANLVESSYDRLVSGDETGAERFWKSLGHTVVPPHEVNAVALYYEMQSGVDFFSGRNIVPERLAPFDNHYQYDAYSSELAKVIGRNSSLSPKHVDHVIRRLGGTLGRDALTIGNYGASFFGGPSRIETPVEDAFIFGRNFGRAAVGSRSVEYFWRNMKRNGGEFTKVAKSYAALIDKGLTDPSANVEARQYLAGMDDDKRAYALLEAHFSEKHEDLHPLNRAKQVATIASRIKTSMVDGTLIRESTRKRGSTERETIELDPKTRRRVKTLFEKIAMREVHNAMKLSNIPGWKQKQIWNVKPLLVELRTLSPAVADEYEARLYKVGRDKIYPFEGVQKYWPEARKRLLKNGANADLSDLAAEAKYFGR